VYRHKHLIGALATRNLVVLVSYKVTLHVAASRVEQLTRLALLCDQLQLHELFKQKVRIRQVAWLHVI
jgi:hypothetical protein